jgi:ketosteroid isomerase-like protein
MSQQAQSTNRADVEAINNVREAHIAALNDDDVDAWVAAFTDDSVQMPPKAPANLGSESIRAWSQAFLTPFRVQFTLFVEEVQVAGS